MIELTPETKQIFAEYPLLKQIWEENIDPPVFASRTPHEVCHYMGGNTFIPVFRRIDGEVVEYNEPEEGPYAHLVVADDVPISLSVGDQEIFNYLHLIDMPEFKLTHYEAELTIAEMRLEELRNNAE
jgi:hypothetical protein